MNEDEKLFADEDDMILPEGWDGESEIFDNADAESEDDFDLDDPTTDTEEEVVEDEEEGAEETEEAAEESKLDVAEETKDTTEEEPAQDELTDRIEKQSQPKLKVTFNHEDRELDMEEAKMYAQKGMNYDRLEPTYREATQLAKELGYNSLKEMIDETKKNRFDDEVQSMVDDGLSESTARSIVESNRRAAEERRIAQQQADEAEALRVEQQREQERMNAEVDMFVRAFPGVTVIPDSVKQAVSTGVPLTAAYAQYVANQSKIELEKQKQLNDAEKRAPVRGVTNYGKTETKTKSAFEEGFDEDDW